MDKLLRLARRTARAGTWFGGALTLAAALLTSADVLVRKLFDVSLGGASEISGYVLAVSSAWALALALLDRAHVRIDSLYALLPVRLRALLDLAGLAAFMLFAGLATWLCFNVFLQSAQLDAHSLTPLAIPQFLWVAGLAFFFAVMALLLVRALPDLVPSLVIFAVIIGSIYAGVAAPTESAALGVVAALVLAASRRRLSWRMLRDACEGTMKTAAMIMAILIAAYFVNFVITSIGLSGKVMQFVTGMGLSPTGTLVVIVLFYVVLGMFMESLSMLVATVPIITPVVTALGFDPVWFGVLMMLLIETALITPPVGFNLFVVQGVRPRGQIYDVILGSAPFVVTLMVMIALLIVFPQIAMWAPYRLRG